MKPTKKQIALFLLCSLIHINRILAQAPGGVSANLTVWYKADAPSTITGNPVSAWTPSGGSATTYSVTQATASKRPTLVPGATGYTKFNYNPRIQFNATNLTSLRNSAITPDLLGTNGVAILLSDQAAPNGTEFSYYTNSSYRYQLKPAFRFQSGGLSGLGYTFDYTAPTEYPLTAASMLVGYGCGSTCTFRENSVPLACHFCGISTYNPAIISGLGFGSNNTSEYVSNGLGEVIFYSVKPTLAQMDQIESYLAVKYGITRGGNTGTSSTYNYIASNGSTVLWDKAANTGYNNDIAAIGRDDVSGLKQKQSISVNNGEAVTISLGTGNVPTENATNGSSFTNNISFLAWGNNGLTTSFNTAATKPAGILERLNRVWKTQSTNFSDVTCFGFETASITGAGAIGTLCLLFDDDGDFSNATVVDACAATNPTGNRIEFTNITIPAGKPYFTLARVKLPTFAANNGPLCEGTALNLTTDTISGSTYAWSGPNSYGSSTSLPSINPAGVSNNGTYTVAITNAYGCGVNTFTTAAVINATVTPAVSVTASTNTICAGNAVSFTAAPTNGGTAPAYQWQVNGVNTGSNSPVFSSATLNNSDVITVALTSNANCLSTPNANSNTVAIAVQPVLTPSVSISASTNTICAGSPVSFTASTVNGGTVPAYQWQVNGVNAGTNSAGFSSSTLNNGDTVSVILTSNENCLSTNTANSNTVAIAVSPIITPSVSVIASTNAICAGSPVSFTAVPTNGGTTPAYQWQVNGSNAGTNSPNFNSSVLNNGDVVTVIMTSNANCVSPNSDTSSVITMTVSPVLTPSVSITASTNTICAGSPVSFAATASNGGTVPSYQWQVNGANVGIDSAGYISSNLNNGDVVTAVLTSNAACLSTATANSNTVAITVMPVLTPSVSVVASTNTICAGNPVSFTASATNGGTTPAYQWQVNGVNAGMNSPNFSASSLNNGDVVSVVLTSNAACLSTPTANSSTVAITVMPNLTPAVSIAASTGTICAGSPVSFTASATNGGTAPSYQWQVNGSNAGTNSPNFSSSSLNNGDVVTAILTSNETCLLTPTANSNSITITVQPNLTPSVSISASTNTICAGSPVSFTASASNGGSVPVYQWQVNGVGSGTNSANFSSSVLNNGDVVTVILTSNAACLTTSTANSNTISISVTPLVTPSVSIAASTNTICAGSLVSFTATATNGGTVPAYQWQINGINAGTNSPGFNSSALNNGDVVTVILSSNATCVSPSTATSNAISISVSPIVTPSVSVVASTNTICAGNPVSFTASATNGGTTPAYQWQVNGVNAGTNSSNFSSSTVNNGDVITAILTSNATCLSTPTANSNTVSITVQPNLTPSVSIVASTNTICAGSPVSLTTSASNGGTAPAYQWQVNGINTGTNSSTFSSSSLNSGDVITVVLTSNATCLSTATANSNTISITVMPILTPSVSITASTNTICAASPVSFTATATNGGTAPVYQWQVNGSNVGTNSPNFNSPGLNNGDVIQVILTSNAVCASPANANSNAITMIVSPIVTPSVSIAASTDSICAGGTISFTTSIANGGSIPSYQWQVNGVNAGTNAPGFTSSTWSNGDVVTLVMTSNANCLSAATANSNTITITVLPIITPSVSIIASTNTICAGSPVTFTATGANGGITPAYQWQVNGVNAGSNSSNFSSSALNNGDIVTVILTSNANCTSTSTANSNTVAITVLPVLTPSVSVTASTGTICAGSPVTFTASAANGGTTPVYQWQVNGVNAGTNSPDFNSSALSNGDVVTVILTSYAACASPATATSGAVTMTVLPIITPSVSVIAGTNTICAGSPVTFTASGLNGGSSPAYQWQVNGVNAGTNSTTFSSSSLNNGDVVTVILTSNASCLSSATANSNAVGVTVLPIVIPSVSILASNDNICSGTPVSFTATATNGGTNPGYQWQINGVNTGANSATFTSANLHNGNVITVIMTSNATCAAPNPGSSNAITMTVTTTPTANFNYSPNPVTELDPNVQFHNSSVGATAYSWNFGNLGVSAQPNPTATFPNAGTYVVTLTATNGTCTSVATETIVVEPSSSYYVPNTFTPNGDGLNETYHIVGTGILPDDFEMNIFNRWGELIFLSKNLNAEWDGNTSSGKPVPDGVYVYLFKFKLSTAPDTVVEKAGEVHVFR